MNDKGRESEDSDAARERLIRESLQRLQSLERAGMRSLPRSTWKPPIPPQPAPRDKPAEIRPSVPALPPVASRAASETPAPRKPPPGPTFPATSLFQEAGFDTAALSAEEQLTVLNDLKAQVAACRKCPQLAETRTQTVFADGTPGARLMFIGEAPGADEDRIGLPFVGRAGQLLTDMITKGMGLRREDVYIANILKCRPPENRDPTLEECSNCLPYLERQIEILRPEFLCLLGRTAVSNLLETTLSMGRLRGKWYRYRGIPTLATYHPSYLLRNPASKKDAWEDLQMLMNAMGLPIPSRRK
jgi:DNA polymerase